MTKWLLSPGMHALECLFDGVLPGWGPWEGGVRRGSAASVGSFLVVDVVTLHPPVALADLCGRGSVPASLR